MECRIQVVNQTEEPTTVYLAGHLQAAQVHELHRICAAATGRIRIDLTDLLSADPVGIDALSRLRRTGVELVGVAHYLRRRLA